MQAAPRRPMVSILLATLAALGIAACAGPGESAAVVEPDADRDGAAASPTAPEAGRPSGGPSDGVGDPSPPSDGSRDALPAPEVDAASDGARAPSADAAPAVPPDAAPALPPDAAPVMPPDAAPVELPDAGPFLGPSEAAELYGLRVGARWTYLRSGGTLRWKLITACEDVEVIDINSGEHRTMRAYVRENRGVFGVTSVHYLVVDQTGVRRIRRDDVDEGNLVVFSTYEPSGPRLLNGPYPIGEERAFDQRTAEWRAPDASFRGESETSALDIVLGEVEQTTFAGVFQTLGVEREWTAFNPHNVRSFYAAGVGEVLEETRWPDGRQTPVQIEELVDFTPGYAGCEPVEHPPMVDCGPGLFSRENPWGTGSPGCTDPRVDPWNCGADFDVCPSGVCAGGHCLEGECELGCLGTSICCPMAWRWAAPGCTHPSRDRWNCGGCGVVCPDDLICDHGECVCGPGTGDCGGGVCQDLLLDPANCGACGNACGGERPTCDKGVCVESCLSVDLARCGDDDCVDLTWNDDHCGACDVECGKGTGTTACFEGQCVTCEVAGLTDCGGDCADLIWSDKHCGRCGHDCDDDAVCVFGACVAGDGSCDQSCAEGDQICCQGTCIDPRTNDHHCGGCGLDECEGGCTEACRDGSCVPVDCGGGDD